MTPILYRQDSPTCPAYRTDWHLYLFVPPRPDFLVSYLSSTLVHQHEELQLFNMSPGPPYACGACAVVFSTAPPGVRPQPSLFPQMLPHSLSIFAFLHWAPVHSTLSCLPTYWMFSFYLVATQTPVTLMLCSLGRERGAWWIAAHWTFGFRNAALARHMLSARPSLATRHKTNTCPHSEPREGTLVLHRAI